MLRRPAVLQRVGVGSQLLSVDAAAFGQPVERVLQLWLFTSAVDFCAVAGGNERGLGVVRQFVAKCVERGRDLLYGERKPATQIERRGFVIDA